jgi:hypothetical protein
LKYLELSASLLPIALLKGNERRAQARQKRPFIKIPKVCLEDALGQLLDGLAGAEDGN